MDNLLAGGPAHGLSDGPSTARAQHDGDGHYNPSCEDDDDDRAAETSISSNVSSKHIRVHNVVPICPFAIANWVRYVLCVYS